MRARHAAANPARAAVSGPTVPAQPRRAAFNYEALVELVRMSRERASRARSRPRTEDWNPFRMETEHRFLFPERAMPAKGRNIRMAQDDALTSNNQFAFNAWMAGGLLGNAVSEGLVFLGYPVLSELAQRPEYRLFGEIQAEEMTRKWIEFRGTDDESTKEKDKPKDRNPDDEQREQQRNRNGEQPRSDSRNKEIETKIKELRQYIDEDLKLKSVYKECVIQDRFFGISHPYIDLHGVDLENQRDSEIRTSIGGGRDGISRQKLTKGCLRGFRVIEPLWAYPTTYNAQNPLMPTWYNPQVWYVMGTEIHASRLLSFIGRPVPDILKPAYAFGGLSMSQMAQPYVDIWLRTRESVGEIIHAFSVMVLMTDLSTTTMPGGAGGGAGDILARLALFNEFRDNQGVFAVNKNTEDFKNVSAPISGLDELQAQSQEHLFAIGRIPAVKFAGIQPKGLNATSEGELRAFYDTIHGYQEHFRPQLTTMIDIAQISLFGERDRDITYDFLSLHELTDKEKAEVRKMDAETDQIRTDSGIVSQEDVRRKVVADPDSGFHGLDPEDVPDLLEEEMQGLIPPGAGKGLEAELEQGKEPRERDDDAEGGEQEQDAHDGTRFTFAEDEWSEEDHPRDNTGQFSPHEGKSGKFKAHGSGNLEAQGFKPRKRGSGSSATEAMQVAWHVAKESGKPQTLTVNNLGWILLKKGEKIPLGHPHVVVHPNGDVTRYQADLGDAEDIITPNFDRKGRGGASDAVLPFADPALAAAARRDRLNYLDGVAEVIETEDVDQWNADYDPDHDCIRVQGKVEKKPLAERVNIVLHEAGHRGQFVVDKAAFRAFKAAGLVRKDLFEAIANRTHIHDFERTGRVYDMAGEIFAESYSRACLGMPLPAPLLAFWRQRFRQGARDEFVESKHPRDPEGKFTSGGGSSGGGKSPPAATTPSGAPESGAFNGQWISDPDPKKAFEINAKKVLGSPAKKHIHYRRYVLKLVSMAQASGDAVAYAALKEKLASALMMAAENLVSKGKSAESNEVLSQMAKLGLKPPAGLGGPPPAPAPTEKPAPAPPPPAPKPAAAPPPPSPAPKPSFPRDAKHRTTMCDCTSQNLGIPDAQLRI